MKFSFLFLTSFLCLASVSLAQSPPISVKLSAVGLDTNVGDISYVVGEKRESLYVYRNQRSKTFDYTGPQTIHFFQGSGAGATKIAEAKVPGATGQYLLLFAEDTNAPGAYRVLVIEDDWMSFKPGMYRFMNLTPYAIAIKIGEEMFQVEPNRKIDASGDFVDGNYYETMVVSIPKGEKPLRVFEGHIYYSESRRTIYLMTPKAGRKKGRVEFTAIPEAVPSQPTEVE